MTTRTISALLLALVLVPGAAAAQAPRLGAAGAYESYSFADPGQTGIRSISLLSVPLGARVPLFGGAAVQVTGNWARGTVERDDGTTTTLQGFTDTQVGLVLPLRRDLASVTAVAILPTGKERQTPDEAVVAGIVAADLLPFRISNWGAGGGAGVATQAEHRFGAIGVGASVGYFVGRQYDLLDQPGYGYRPGNQLRARLALDASTGVTGKASLQLTYLHSNEDALNGANLFRAGDRFQAVGSYAFAAGGQASGILYAGVLHRAQGTYLVDRPVDAPSQNLLLGGGGFRVPVGRMVLLPAVDVRVLRRSDGYGQGVTTGLGGSAELPLGAHATLVPELRGRFGRVLVSQASESNFTGFDLALGLRFGGAQ